MAAVGEDVTCGMGCDVWHGFSLISCLQNSWALLAIILSLIKATKHEHVTCHRSIYVLCFELCQGTVHAGASFAKPRFCAAHVHMPQLTAQLVYATHLSTGTFCSALSHARAPRARQGRPRWRHRMRRLHNRSRRFCMQGLCSSCDACHLFWPDGLQHVLAIKLPCHCMPTEALAPLRRHPCSSIRLLGCGLSRTHSLGRIQQCSATGLCALR